MNIHFKKFQGTGNDFVMINCLDDENFELSDVQIAQLCDRRFGIGADGVICIYSHPEFDFEMRYYNSDGSRSFCGNGARCAVQFARSLNCFEQHAQFLAIDGAHTAHVENGIIALKMANVSGIDDVEGAFVLNTGSPHYVKFVEALSSWNIVEFGRRIRFSPSFKSEGINVNLVQRHGDNRLEMLTYERGVEDETHSCGTGATAVALAHFYKRSAVGQQRIEIGVKGGELAVQATSYHGRFTDIFLIGPAKEVFYGSITI
ncbi:MAG: diaminopimelate epimerase [Bacteroidota bacterium]